MLQKYFLTTKFLQLFLIIVGVIFLVVFILLIFHSQYFKII